MWHERTNTQLVEPGDRAFWENLWRTDEFRALFADPRTGYGQVLDAAAKLPWWFVDSEQAYERRHFSVWFGNAFVRREYDNPVITDLFYWHDLLHALTFRRFAEPTNEAAWRLAMRANEIAVSMETETLIYWRHPGLRAKGWQQEIWFDQLQAPLSASLRNRLASYREQVPAFSRAPFATYERDLREAVMNPWPLPFDPAGTTSELDWNGLWDLRRAVTRKPDLNNAIERDIARYESMADPFFFHWSNDWKEVEDERFAFQALCDQGLWKEAVARRQAHWARVSNADGVPYGDIAQALVPIGF